MAEQALGGPQRRAERVVNRLVAGGFVIIVLIETVAFLIRTLACAARHRDRRRGLGGAGLDPTGGIPQRRGRSRGRRRREVLAAVAITDQAAIAWADGTPGDWDRHLRPDWPGSSCWRPATRPGTPSTATGRMVFGDDLWPWVDSSNVRWADRDAPGPGRPALGEILRRLEQV